MQKLFRYMLLALVLPCLLATGCSENEESVKMTARVTAIGDKIEVEVIESEYTSGPYHVITSGDTVFQKNGIKIDRDGIKVGDTVEIYYSGQVMLSYPPQIVAHKIAVV